MPPFTQLVRLNVCVFSLLFTFAAATNQSFAEDPLNLLFFGNSFTIGDNVPNAVGRIAEADGKARPTIVADLAGGQDLDYHIGQVNSAPQNNVLSSAIGAGQFDFAILQGYSTEATHLQSPATDFIPDAVAMSNLLRSFPTASDAGIILFETWAREAPHSFYSGTNPSFANPAAMQAEIRDNYALASEAINQAIGQSVAEVAPVGDAFEQGGFDGFLYASDNYHASRQGSRLASLVIYRSIYNENVGDISYDSVSSWANVSSSEWSTLTSLADSVQITAIPEPSIVAPLMLLSSCCLLKRKRKTTAV
ncbi:PEP-CTERM sorting domain-containing protein [Stieleria sp. JC731]|uniref:PEP-CTERM sorting domain-containing protein n=1 Tax=Pirellulaceae TaxID=2691357 RepID=UPI001E413248|nr:PEP-CTERM sorting domain-containing protein [Stieleria sp. JC731]MCC9603235.1 PEP-CTERM sorting domain-containing protein [Stieleria sp. JC731]